MVAAHLVLFQSHKITFRKKNKPVKATYISRQENNPLSRKRKFCTAVRWKQLIPSELNKANRVKVYHAWLKLKDSLTGYVRWDDIADDTKINVSDISSMIKQIWNTDRSAISLNANRMGDLTYFRINKPELFLP